MVLKSLVTDCVTESVNPLGLRAREGHEEELKQFIIHLFEGVSRFKHLVGIDNCKQRISDHTKNI